MLVALCDLVFQFDTGIPVQASEEVRMDVKVVETGGQVSRTRNVWETMLTMINYYAGATSAAGDVQVRTFFSLFPFFLSFFFLFFAFPGKSCMGYAQRAIPGSSLSYHGWPRLRLLSSFKF